MYYARLFCLAGHILMSRKEDACGTDYVFLYFLRLVSGRKKSRLGVYYSIILYLSLIL